MLLAGVRLALFPEHAEQAIVSPKNAREIHAALLGRPGGDR
jgi:hypothetical protein